MIKSLFPRIFNNIGIDLGTANTIVYLEHKDFVINQPSVIAFTDRGILRALGQEAREMMGKTHPGLKVMRPMADGVISDFIAAEQMIKGFIRLTGVPRFLLNRMVVGVPTGITPVEKKAVVDSAHSAGASRVFLVAEPMAAAIGVGLDVLDSEAAMIVDIGGGTTDIAVINYGGIVLDNTLRIAGDELNEALVRHFKNYFHLKIGLRSAERLKMLYGIAHISAAGEHFEVQGIDTQNRMPRRLKVNPTLFLDAFDFILKTIADTVLRTLEELPPDLASDLIDRGIILSGGGALLNGLDTFLREQIKIPVSIPDNALFSVAEGTRKIIQEFQHYQPILMHH